VNCTSLPDGLIESELFGHARGAFTDAREEKPGLIELADGGTILLDEIGDMPLSGQAKILQFLETHTLRRVGGVSDRSVDTHVIAATNRDLEEAVRAGAFREDLYYRLNVLPIVVPPLRDRPDDIAPLAIHFIDSLTEEMRLSSRTLEPEALQAMERYSWPGNARQLRNIIERILLLEDDETISLSHLPAEIRGGVERDPGVVLPPSGMDLEELERGLMVQALERTHGNKAAAARLLRVSRDTMRYRIEKHGLV
jgi:transcriptional regulator with PAS, ATPase and Fis domain